MYSHTSSNSDGGPGDDESQELMNQYLFFLGRFFIFSIFSIILLPASVQADDDSFMAKLAGHSMLLDGVSIDGLMAVVGERGHILISTDGKQWQQVAVPTRQTLTGVYFQDRKNGWSVVHDAVIFRTTDGRKS